MQYRLGIRNQTSVSILFPLSIHQPKRRTAADAQVMKRATKPMTHSAGSPRSMTQGTQAIGKHAQARLRLGSGKSDSWSRPETKMERPQEKINIEFRGIA